jgi:serine/threonine protein kinase/Tol biopolymer transport system component
MSLQPDVMLGPYRILALIGEGGMGAVYRARDTRLGRDVAVKVLTNITVGDEEKLQRFEQEARATGMLNHPNLLTIFDIGNEAGTPYIVGELLEGMTLRERIERGAMPPRKAVDAALQMAQGLAAAHEKGIVHRDLKPENIFLTREGRVKILDFGIAKLNAGFGSNDGPTFSPAATEPGMVLGTVGYMSPEQVRGEAVDHRSDIFAFGAILYEMLTGQRAFKRDTGIETLSAILREDPPEVSEVNPNVPQPLERLVRRCLDKDRDHRFQSALDLAFNLETLSSFSTPGTFSGSVQTPAVEASPSPVAPRMPPNDARAPGARGQAPTLVTHATPPAPPAGGTMRTSARPPLAGRPPRPTTSIKAPRRTSPLLLTLLFLVAVGGAAFGGWYAAHQQTAAREEVAYHRITFRRGEVRTARFSPDGDTIVYSAAWEGHAPEVFVATRQSAEARPLGIGEADVLAVSKSTELAVMLRRDRVTGLGTLARVPMAGGLPREVADSVSQADWSPDGSTLAIIHVVGGKSRIESPVGTVRYETVHPIRDLRFSPDGARMAFVETIQGENHVSILDGRTPSTIAQGWAHGVAGLAWAPDGRQLWLTGTSTAAPPALYAISVDDGTTKPLTRMAGSMKLFDISSAGRVLLTSGGWRAAIEYQPAGQTDIRDVSWLDWSILADLSADGQTILFNESREGGGPKGAVYIRRADAAVPIKIGDGFGDGLSPDGKLALCHEGSKLVVLPTGTGEERELKIHGSFNNGVSWFPDNKRVVIAGATDKGAYQLHVLDTLDETIRPITPENIAGAASVVRPFAISPDGRFVAGLTTQESIALYPADGGGAAIPVAAALPGEIPVQWSSDGAWLYVYKPSVMPAQINRINMTTGAREVWKEFTPRDPAGVYRIAPVMITPDGTAYAYDSLRTTSDLYVVEGLR